MAPHLGLGPEPRDRHEDPRSVLAPVAVCPGPAATPAPCSRGPVAARGPPSVLGAVHDGDQHGEHCRAVLRGEHRSGAHRGAGPSRRRLRARQGRSKEEEEEEEEEEDSKKKGAAKPQGLDANNRARGGGLVSGPGPTWRKKGVFNGSINGYQRIYQRSLTWRRRRSARSRPEARHAASGPAAPAEAGPPGAPGDACNAPRLRVRKRPW